MSMIMLPVGLGLLAATAIAPSSLGAPQSSGANVMANAVSGAFLDGDALRELFADAYVVPFNGGHDGPAEYFRANGHYRRQGGMGAVVFEGSFEVRDGAVCVWGENSAPLCRRVRTNGDGTYTFVNIADGSTAIMAITRSR